MPLPPNIKLPPGVPFPPLPPTPPSTSATKARVDYNSRHVSGSSADEIDNRRDYNSSKNKHTSSSDDLDDNRRAEYYDDVRPYRPQSSAPFNNSSAPLTYASSDSGREINRQSAYDDDSYASRQRRSGNYAHDNGNDPTKPPSGGRHHPYIRPENNVSPPYGRSGAAEKIQSKMRRQVNAANVDPRVSGDDKDNVGVGGDIGVGGDVLSWRYGKQQQASSSSEGTVTIATVGGGEIDPNQLGSPSKAKRGRWDDDTPLEPAKGIFNFAPKVSNYYNCKIMNK